MKMHLIVAAALVALSSHAAFAASEGGDSWSELQATPLTETPQLPVVATTANLSVLQRDNPSAYGTPADANSAERSVQIQLGPDSQWVNVNYAESVRFVASEGNGIERSFAWRFDVSPAVSEVDLSEIAPADFPDHHVRVFVAEDPRYGGD
jgi:hypothetical protein